MDESQIILKEQYKKLPTDLKKFVLGNWWSDKVSEITRRFNVDNNNQVTIENEVFLVLVGLEPYTDLAENIARESTMNEITAGLIAEDIVKNILIKVEEEMGVADKISEKFGEKKIINKKLEESKKIAEEQRKKMEEIKKRAEENLKKLENVKDSYVEVVEENIEKGEKQAIKESKNEILEKTEETTIIGKKDNQLPTSAPKSQGSLEPLRSMKRDSQKLSQNLLQSKGGFIPTDTHGEKATAFAKGYGESTSETSEDIISVIENPEKVKIPEIEMKRESPKQNKFATGQVGSINYESRIMNYGEKGKEKEKLKEITSPKDSGEVGASKKEGEHAIALAPKNLPTTQVASNEQLVVGEESVKQNMEVGNKRLVAGSQKDVENKEEEIVDMHTKEVAKENSSQQPVASSQKNVNKEEEREVGVEEVVDSKQKEPQISRYPEGRDPYRETIE